MTFEEWWEKEGKGGTFARTFKEASELAWEASQPQWQTIDTAPKTYKPVMLFFRTKRGYPVTVIAHWIAEFSEQSSEDFAEYDAKTDEYYLPAGWYEQQWFNNEYAYVHMNERPTHWMPIQQPPED